MASTKPTVTTIYRAPTAQAKAVKTAGSAAVVTAATVAVAVCLPVAIVVYAAHEMWAALEENQANGKP